MNGNQYINKHGEKDSVTSKSGQANISSDFKKSVFKGVVK